MRTMVPEREKGIGPSKCIALSGEAVHWEPAQILPLLSLYFYMDQEYEEKQQLQAARLN